MISAVDESFQSEGPAAQAWRFFKGDKLAVLGGCFLIGLIVLAFLGKFLTEWIVVFDPSTVRLPDKLLPPMSQADPILNPVEDIPLLGFYILGTDELGREVFARPTPLDGRPIGHDLPAG